MRSPAFLFLITLLALRVAGGQTVRSTPRHPLPASVLRLDDLSYKQIKALDPNKTVVLMTLGVIEEHGPHLPVSVDTIHAEELTRRLATSIPQDRRGTTVVVFPTVVLGARGTNVLGNKPTYVGSITVRPSVLRSLLADVGTMLAEQGFRNILLIYAHGNPMHSQMVNEAAEFVRDTTGARMWNITSIVLANWSVSKDAAAAACLTDQQRQKLGMDIHGGTMETSITLFLAPRLVSRDYKTLPPIPAQNLLEIIQHGKNEDWPGYWGFPAWASARCGEVYVNKRSEVLRSLALRAIDGEDLSTLPQYPNNLSALDPATQAAFQETEQSAQRYEADLGEKLKKWLEAHKKQP